jgi:hypothetical protein
MKAYYTNIPEMWIPFGEPIERNYSIPDEAKPYLCVYLQSELDAYTATKHNKQVGFWMAERYIRQQVQPFLQFKGECLLAKEYL